MLPPGHRLLFTPGKDPVVSSYWSLSFTPDGKALVFSANRAADWELDPQESEVFSIDLATHVSTGVIADTLLGPVFTGASFGFDGATRVYIAIGRIF